MDQGGVAGLLLRPPDVNVGSHSNNKRVSVEVLQTEVFGQTSPLIQIRINAAITVFLSRIRLRRDLPNLSLRCGRTPPVVFWTVCVVGLGSERSGLSLWHSTSCLGRSHSQELRVRYLWGEIVIHPLLSSVEPEQTSSNAKSSSRSKSCSHSYICRIARDVNKTFMFPKFLSSSSFFSSCSLLSWMPTSLYL